MSIPADQHLCIECGFCCDGTLFTRVRITEKDSGEKLRSLGLDVREDFSEYFRQPCPQFTKQGCKIYEDRPTQCAKFRCLLLKSFQAGVITNQEAKDSIKLAKDLKADKDSSPEAKEGYHKFLKQTFGDQNGNPYSGES